MIDEVTKLAAFVSSSLTKVDKNMLSTGSAGPANQINVHKFVGPSPQPVQPAPAAAPAPQPLPAPAIIGAGRIEPSTSVVSVQSVGTSPEHVESIVKSLDRIATEISKINKKMTSIQKYLSQKNNEHPKRTSETVSDSIESD